MASYISAMQNNYTTNFPAEVPTKAAQGFIITGAVSLLYGSSANVALLGGAIAVTATLIEALTRPIIKAIFPENPFIVKCIQVCVPRILALGGAIALAPWIGVSYEITSFFIPLIAWIALNDRFYERNVGMVEVL
jgi:hypothetical protein